MDPGLRTVHLGRFEEARADAIVAALDRAGIAWSFKSFGGLTRLFFAEWGVRLFVDASRLDEARAIVSSVPSGGTAPQPPTEEPPTP